jgi:uncharacterized protein YkwD
MRRSFLILLLVALVGCGGGALEVPRTPTSVEPTTQEEAMEDTVHALINEQRTGNGLAPLVHDEAIRAVARAHSQDMVARDFFDHVNPDGLDPFDRLAMDFITYSAAGENIAWNRGYSDPAAVAVEGWMNSSGHRANILNGTYTHTGVGVARSEADGAWYFTQVFTLPTGSLVVTWVEQEDGAVSSPDAATSSWTIAR